MNEIPTIKLKDTDVEMAILNIAIASGRNEKEHALRELAATEEGRRVINWCYNPFITFGITWPKEPTYRTPESVESWNELPLVDNLLTSLASRDLSGNAAKEAVSSAFASLNPAAARILWLCLNKDLKAGVAEASIRGIDPSLIPLFAVMRAHLFEEKHVKSYPVAVEPKLDGNRVTFISRDGSGGFFTRTGKVIAALDHMVPVVLNMLKGWFNQTRVLDAADPLNVFLSKIRSQTGVPMIVLDGEMMSDKGFDDVNGALNRQEDVHGLSFHIFDCMTWEEFDAMGDVEVKYVDRRRRVMSIAVYASGVGMAQTIKQTPIKVCHSAEDVFEAYAEYRAQGFEGAMVKDPNGFYQKKKSRQWLKMKNEDTEDLPVIGVYQGKAGGKYADTIGGLIVDRNGVEVRVSGISDAMREEIWKLWLETADACGFDHRVGYEGASFKNEIETCSVPTILLGRLIEVEFHEATKDGSLRHPRFIRFRDDKTGEIDK